MRSSGVSIIRAIISCAHARQAPSPGALLLAAEGAAEERLKFTVTRGSPEVRRLLSQLSAARREVRTALVNLRAVQLDALGDAAVNAGDGQHHQQLTIAIKRLAHLTLAASVSLISLDGRTRAELSGTVAQLAEALRTGTPPAGLELPALSTLTHTDLQLREIRDLICGPEPVLTRRAARATAQAS